jgi:hypothetical protein
VNYSSVSLGFSSEKLAFIDNIGVCIDLSDNSPELITANMLLSIEFQVVYLLLIIAMFIFFEYVEASCILFYFRNE